MTERRWRNAHRRIVAADLRPDDAVLPMAGPATRRGTTVEHLDAGSRRVRLGGHAWVIATFVVCAAGVVAMGPALVMWLASLRTPGWLELTGFALDTLVWVSMAYWALIILGYWRFRARQRLVRSLARRRR